MKKLAIFLLMILAVANSFAQSAEELSILDALNKYREANRLPKVSYSKEMSKAARHHATYLSHCNKLDIWPDNHDENFDIKSWNELSFSERAILLRKNGYIVDGEIQIQNGFLPPDEIIKAFHGSPPHREIMRNRNSKLAGIGNVDGAIVIVFGNGF
jgi:uncharacterized protein YkwD